MAGATVDYGEFDIPAISGAIDWAKTNAPPFTDTYNAFIGLWPEISRHGDEAMKNEWMAIKGEADTYMYYITRLNQFYQSAGSVVKSVMGLSGALDDALTSLQNFIGRGMMYAVPGVPGAALAIMGRMQQFIQSAPARLYDQLKASGATDEQASEIVNNWIAAQNQPSALASIANMLPWIVGGVIAIMILPKLLGKNNG